MYGIYKREGKEKKINHYPGEKKRFTIIRKTVAP